MHVALTNDALFRIQVSRGLVDQVDISRLSEAEDERDTLELTT